MTTTDLSTGTVRFSRTIGPGRAIALGSSVAGGLGIFALIGPALQLAGGSAWIAYLAAALIFLPVLAALAERAAVTPGSGGLYALVRAGGGTARMFAAGWLLLGGHLALIALLGWGAARYLDAGLQQFFGVSVAGAWLAPAIIIGVALNDVLGTQGGWRLRTTLVYAGLVVVVVLSSGAWLVPVAATTGVGASPARNLFDLAALLAAGLWGANFILDSRDEIRRPALTLPAAILVMLLLLGLLGAAAAAAAWRIVGTASPLLPQVDPALLANRLPLAQVQTATIVAGTLLCVIALDRAMVTMLRLIGALVRDGFLPQLFLQIAPGLGTPLFALRVLIVPCALAAALVPVEILAGLAGVVLLGTALLLVLPEVFTLHVRLPANRRFKLPFHPLMPILVVLCNGFLILAAPLAAQLAALAWLGIGGLYYTGYARRQGLVARRREAVVGEPVTEQAASEYTVLVCVANPRTAPALIRLGADLARRQNGRLLVLQIALFPDQVPQFVQRLEAQDTWRNLIEITRRVETPGVPIETLVRLAQNPIDGILATAEEERAQVMVLGWEGEIAAGTVDLGPLIDPIVRSAACEVVVLRGMLPPAVQRVLVPTAGSPNTMAAIGVACRLVAADDGKVVALRLLEPASLGQAEQIRQQLTSEIRSATGRLPDELRLIPGNDVKHGILHEARDFDLLVLGASRGGMLDQTIFGGLPVEVAYESPIPALLVKHLEDPRRFWLRRVWELISTPLPTPTLSERSEVYQQLRRAARPSVDFFILIALASIIATLGLVQGSPAVIIGAMLVAPLMSPILAMAMGIVHGNLRMLRSATGATLLGIVVAIGFSVPFSLILPGLDISEEILVRTRPTFLDLLVALASGAAGGYAIGRKEVAAALPGVAIAAALVPPLGTVGYGIAAARFDIAGGAMLLFTTNLIAIIVAAAVIFLLLGFRPAQASVRPQARVGLLTSVVALGLITLPLGFVSLNTLQQSTQQRQVEGLLAAALDSDDVRLTDVVVTYDNSGLVVNATAYTRTAFSAAQVAELETALRNAVGQPVSLRLTVLPALLLPERGDVLLPQPTPQP